MYVDASSYDNLRKIASVTDGLKNSGRKVLSTVMDKNIKSEVKVSRLKSTVSEHTEYLHGEDNLSDVIVNMARRYTGSNNLPLMRDEGNFGKRFINNASADRYISTAGESYINYLFPKVDNNILVEQVFEGVKIEPRFFIPVVPMLLVNGSPAAVSSGFKQVILPRPLNQIIKATEKYIETGEIKIPKPGWAGFKGTVTQDKDNKRKWIVRGKFKRINTTTLEILEVPVGVELKKYQMKLDDLVENKIISSYEDKCENNIFNFKVRVSRKFMEMTDEEILQALGLVDKGVNFVELYAIMGSDNRMDIVNTPEDIFKLYASVREEYYVKRKEYLVTNTIKEIKALASKFFFIKGVTEDTITINKKSKAQVLKQIEPIANIITDEEGSYDYLLRMPIYSLTTEKMDELKQSIKDKKFLLTEYKEKDPTEFWKEDLEILKSHI